MKAKDVIALAGVLVAIVALIPSFGQWLSKKPEQTVTTREKETVYIVQQPTSPPASSQGSGTTQQTSSSGTVTKPASKPTVRSDATAILIVDGQNSIDWTLTDQIKSILQRKGHKVSTPSLFTSSFVAKGQFGRIFGGDSGEAQQLQLSQYFKEGFLGKKAVSFTENPDLENIITANVKLEIHVISSSSGTVQRSITLTAKGPGFSQDDAEKIAIENILKDATGKL